VETNKATITLQFATTILMAIWWIAVWALYVASYTYNGFVTFLMLIMGYWTFDVLANIAHVTTCGVTAVWWFNKEKMANPTWTSYRYATAQGLGSICCGSLLVAIIQTLRSMAKNGARRGNITALICCLFLSILDWLIQYFNAYAFVQVAVYGVTYYQAAKNTWDLLRSRGFDAIINDNLIDTVLAAGAVVGGVITFLVGGVVSFFLFTNIDLAVQILIAVLMAIVGFYIGFYITLKFMFAVHSAIKAIFVCWAEDPAALKETHPLCYQLMSEAWAQIYGGTSVQYDSINAMRDLD